MTLPSTEMSAQTVSNTCASEFKADAYQKHKMCIRGCDFCMYRMAENMQNVGLGNPGCLASLSSDTAALKPPGDRHDIMGGPTLMQFTYMSCPPGGADAGIIINVNTSHGINVQSFSVLENFCK